MPSPSMFQRKTLDLITEIPDDIISVYVVENHIWAGGGSDQARAGRRAERRTVEEFLIDPVRSFLNDIFRQMAAPYVPERRDNPIGQGYWVQAEFGSGKSHLLSFVGALALGGEAEWELIREKETKAGLGRRESLYSFYESGLAKKSADGKGILVAVKTLVGEGGGGIGLRDSGRRLSEYILDAVGDQFYLENGRSLPLYPVELLAERFLNTRDFELYRDDLGKFLRDPGYFDEEQQEDIADFLDDLQNDPDPGVQRDCGQRLWDFYNRYLKIRPQIPMETEDILKHMVRRLLDEGYAGLLLILDEVSLFMQGRTGEQRVEDEKALVVLSNRLAKVENLPVWTVCAAQQAIESTMAGVKNIIARERLDLVPLLSQADAYYQIALNRVRQVTDPAAVDQYYEDYKRSFSWPQAEGKDRFSFFFPFYPPSIQVVREVSLKLTTVRSALYFMLQTLKTQRKRKSRELISLWSLFDDVVEYEEDPSGTTRAIASIKTKWPEAWRAYETAKAQLDTQVKGRLKVYRSRCEKIAKTLFLYHVANLAPNGLSHEELMNAVMEWRNHEGEQDADLEDNIGHYLVLADDLEQALPQIEKVGQAYRFNPEHVGIVPGEHFRRARAEAESSEVLQQQAWHALLALDSWEVSSQLMTMDLAHGVQSIFRDIAPSSQDDITVKWHGREITGRVYMRDLLDIAKRGAPLPSINSSETGLDYAVYVSSVHAGGQLASLVRYKGDPRVLFWSPGELTSAERARLLEFAAYRTLVGEYQGQDTEDARVMLDWVQRQLRGEMGAIYRIVPDSYRRGRIDAVDHAEMPFTVQGELSSILAPLVAQALDATYVCSEMDFDAPAPFNDTNAVNVINGIVKVGRIPRGAKPNRDISAAQNYGFALQIMRKPNDRKLDLSQCRYTRDIMAWIESKLGDIASAMPAVTVYKNFMGVGGPGGRNYGLSKRMVQLYLLCLVREGKIRITISGRNVPVEVIDYTNIADIDFKVAVLDAFDQIHRLKPPEGWDTLAPFAAVLLQDESLRRARQDADIQDAVQRLIAYKDEKLPAFTTLRTGLTELLDEVGRVEPVEERLEEWEQFLASPVAAAEPIPFLRNALKKAFGYPVYPEDRVRPQHVDDLAARRAEVGHAASFYGHRDRLRAAARYLRADLPDVADLATIRDTLMDARASLDRLAALIENEAQLLTAFLEPVEQAIDSYSVRYLQVFDRVTARAETVRMAVDALPTGAEYRVLARLAQLEALGDDLRPQVNACLREVLDDPARLSPSSLSRADVERLLREWPQPPQCALTLANASDWIARADAALASCEGAVHSALVDRATLLGSEALRERLVQGRGEPFIAGLLSATTAEDVARYLVETLGAEQVGEPDPVALLKRYLKKLQVRKLSLADFAPSKRTIEKGDVDQVVDEFRAFLLGALRADEDELPVVELE